MAVDLTGRRALVTGGASGLGKAMCESFAEAGATVVVADVDAEAAGAVAEAIGGEAWAVNLADTSALDGIDLEVDILVNNAGIQRIHPIPEFPLEEWQLIMTIMLEAPFVLTKAALPGMYERGWGRVINVSSVHGLRASANKSAYVAAKHGLMGLTKTTALEAGPRGVTCNAINPGYVLTPLVKGQIADQAVTNGISEDEVLEKVFLGHSAVPRLAEPEDIAALALFLASDAAAVVTGTAHSIDGGWTAA
ncbi:3-hydroxybutyrate dehydrogenase [Brevibacterium casei]|uniref:3-hydroxybutyrate dehydrogenase n=1 Tax=Brevibacterium casei CIP 102111 TaxID=1255625 RepID=A0A2H1HLK1_9MICO|nr:3-hydroxybutyrate dehydrogenase [Brevibacterium casei]MCT1550867.1 3-hydroxybutyrate dehydrogenase [Brevibacterium casei]MCT1560075.1 3-hydroxybutyrate dehydrogenase [Brevibacterium casei]MCT2208713.1 3-hydroxybutyrate dehydrogenase [Brevibacterium casei]QPR38688.1 3-hydroxybutyrate dehydrogenase [Brevibacterium casei]QPR42854.1 3-hydroxybutyrate dehydrogenase [Brevibacterium casei]